MCTKGMYKHTVKYMKFRHVMTMSRHNISDQQTSQKIKQPEMVAPFVTFHVGHDSVLNMLNVHMYVAPKEGGGQSFGRSQG